MSSIKSSLFLIDNLLAKKSPVKQEHEEETNEDLYDEDYGQNLNNKRQCITSNETNTNSEMVANYYWRAILASMSSQS